MSNPESKIAKANISSTASIAVKVSGVKKIRLGRKISVDSSYSTGKRKEAVAKVWMWPVSFAESSCFLVNAKDHLEYFSASREYVQIVQEVFNVLSISPSSYCVVCEVIGGGISAQAEAIRLGLAKLMSSIFATESKAMLKSGGFLTRDARVVEAKKTGYRKARKKEQFSKR